MNYLSKYEEMYNDGFNREEMIDQAYAECSGNKLEFDLMIDAINFICGSEGL